MIWLPLLIGVPLFFIFRKHTLAQWLAYLAGLGYFIILMVWWITTPSTPAPAPASGLSDTAMAIIWILGIVLALVLGLAGYLAIRLWLAGGFRTHRRRIIQPIPAARGTSPAPNQPTPPGMPASEMEPEAAQMVYVEMIRQMPGILRELVIREQLQREAAYAQESRESFIYSTPPTIGNLVEDDEEDSSDAGSSSVRAPDWF